MRRKDPAPPTAAARGKSLISIRTNQQQQQRKAQTKSLLPRSYSSPPTQNEQDCSTSQNSPTKSYMMRSFSTPEQKHLDYRRNSDSFYRPRTHGSRSELDSDLENFEQFDECFLDIDADDTVIGTYSRSPEREEPKRVLAALLPGSGIQRVSIRPIQSSTTHTLQGARDAMKKLQKDEKGSSRLNFRPLVVKMPARHVVRCDHQPETGMEELQSSPQLELEAAELERELDNAEQQLDRGVAIATEESDADTVKLDEIVAAAPLLSSIHGGSGARVVGSYPSHRVERYASASSTRNNKCALTLRRGGAARGDASAAGTRLGFRVRSSADAIRVISGQRDSGLESKISGWVGDATPGTTLIPRAGADADAPRTTDRPSRLPRIE
ncbi:hypothetical protein ACJJTC_006631 [Scirpophaga incertulas]